MDINYQSIDNIVLDSTINQEYNLQSKITDIEYDTDHYNISYNDQYPKLSDTTVIDSTGSWSILEEGTIHERLNIDTSTVLTLSIPLIDITIKEFAAKYLPDEDKYKMTKCNITMSSEKAAAYNTEQSVSRTKIYNTEGSNIIDYILDPDDLFLSTETIYVQGNSQGTMQRENYVSPKPEQEPTYIFECKDSTNVVTYIQIYLEELSQSYGGLSNYYEIKYNDMTSYDSTTDMISISTLPILLKCPIFQEYIRTTLSEYEEVNLLIKINNIETDPSFQYPLSVSANAFIQKQKGTAICKCDLTLNGIESIKAIHKAHILQLRVPSSDFVSYFNSEDQNLFLFINDQDSEFTKLNVSTNHIDFNTKNYFNLNSNVTPFDFEYGDSTVVTVTIVITQPEIYTKKVYKFGNIGLTLSRNQRSHNQLSLVYSNTAEVKQIIRIEKFYITDSAYTINTNKIINIDHLNTQSFFQEETSVQGLDEQDVQMALELIKNVDIKVFYRNLNNRDTYFYVKFEYDKTIQYLRKYLEGDIIQNIVESMIISINAINESGILIKKLISLDMNNLVTFYTGATDVSYIFKHESGNQIININGIFDKKTIDSIKNQGNTTSEDEYYIPKDTIIVTNTQKTN